MIDMRIGRFLQRDPLGFDGGDVNETRFVHNAPTDETDPSGLEPRLVTFPDGSVRTVNIPPGLSTEAFLKQIADAAAEGAGTREADKEAERIAERDKQAQKAHQLMQQDAKTSADLNREANEWMNMNAKRYTILVVPEWRENDKDQAHRGQRFAARFYLLGTTIPAKTVTQAVDDIVKKLGNQETKQFSANFNSGRKTLTRKKIWIEDIQFWGHGRPGGQEIGTEYFGTNELKKMAPLLPYLSPRSRVYFRGCNVFRDKLGHDFAEQAAEYFGCNVAGHTLWTGTNADVLKQLEDWNLPGLPDFPGYQELRPGEKATWIDPPSNAPNNTEKSQNKQNPSDPLKHKVPGQP